MILKAYFRNTPPLLVFLDTLRVFLVASAGFGAYLALRWFSTNAPWAAPLHRRLWSLPDAAVAGAVYLTLVVAAFVINALWMTRVLRNFARLTLVRLEKGESRKKDLEQQNVRGRAVGVRMLVLTWIVPPLLLTLLTCNRASQRSRRSGLSTVVRGPGRGSDRSGGVRRSGG